MPVHPKGYLYQLNDDSSVDEATIFGFAQKFTDGNLTEQQLIYYATYKLKCLYDLFTKHMIKTISLRKPVFIVVTLRKQRYEFICQSISVNYLSKLRPVDLPFRLKKTLFVILPRSMEIKKVTSTEKAMNPSELNRVFNAIDARMQKEFKTYSPVIYTGMTN